MNAYVYANNNPVFVNQEAPNSVNSPLIAYDLSKQIDKPRERKYTPNNPLILSEGLVTPEKIDMPSWMSVYAFYINGNLGWSYAVGDGYSLASLSIGVLDATFHAPKLYDFLPYDHWANPNLYVGVGTWNVSASVGIGVTGRVELVSGTVGVQYGDAINIGLRGYVGIGFALDFTNGIRFGQGFLLGYEVFISINWHELFH